MTDFEEPLDEYARYAVSVKNALQLRQEKRNAYIAALSELDQKQHTNPSKGTSIRIPFVSSSSSSSSNTPSNTEEISSPDRNPSPYGGGGDDAMKRDMIEKAQKNVEVTKEMYENASRRLVYEFELFKRQKEQDMQDIISNFINLQVSCTRN
jgi:hypothetical protein